MKRGGKVVFQDISKPTAMEWGSALEAMQAALELEKTVDFIFFIQFTHFFSLQVNQSLLDLHKVGQDVNDAHFCDFLETEYLGEQVDAIKEISDLITKMIRAGDGLGLHTIDKELEAWVLSINYVEDCRRNIYFQ